MTDNSAAPVLAKDRVGRLGTPHTPHRSVVGHVGQREGHALAAAVPIGLVEGVHDLVLDVVALRPVTI